MEAYLNISFPEAKKQMMKLKKVLLTYRKGAFCHWNTSVHLGDASV